MGDFVLRDFKFIYLEGELREEVLLDLNDNLSNKGRVPFHSELTDTTIPNLVLSNMEKHELFCKNSEYLIPYEPYYALMDVLMIKEHVKSKYPKEIAIIGANDNVLINHFKEIIYDLMPDTGIYSCKESTETDKADMVFINGTSDLDKCDETVELSLKILKKGGLLCAFSLGQKELYKSLEVLVPNGARYVLGKEAYIYAANI